MNITLEVKQLLLRDPRMQDLLFDDVEKDQNEPEADATPEAGAAGGSGATESAGAGAASGAKEPTGNT